MLVRPARDANRALRLVESPEPEVRPRDRAATPLLDDTEILAGLKRGDESAVVALHDRVRRQVDLTILRLLGRRDVDHEDLAQAALIRIVQSMVRFRGECSLDTWASRITAYTVYNELDRRRTEQRVFGSSDADLDPPSSSDVERDALDRSTLGRIRAHLDALEKNKAWTLVLHDVCGYDLREIAEITGVSVAAAQTRLVRGRRELHARLEGDPELADVVRERARSGS